MVDKFYEEPSNAPTKPPIDISLASVSLVLYKSLLDNPCKAKCDSKARRLALANPLNIL